jgi:hypothetical protein
MSEPTGISGIYGTGAHWIRHEAYDRNDISTQYGRTPAEILDIYDRWRAARNGRILASQGVIDALRARGDKKVPLLDCPESNYR